MEKKDTFRAKVKRTFFSVLPVSRGRRGSCRHCGACCALVFTCPAYYVDEKGNSRCHIYKFRPLNCRKYPRTRREWLTEQTCGYWFEKQGAVKAREARTSAGPG